MAVRRDLIDRQRDLFSPAGLGENEAVPLMDGNAPAKIGQSKRALAVSPVRRADDREKRFVLADREQLALAEHPSRRREVAREHPDLSNIWLCHQSTPLVRTRENALQRDPEGQ